MASIANNITPGRSQAYTYDELNRVLTAVTQATSGQTCWGQDFTYDAWANLRAITPDMSRPTCSVNALSVALAANNQLAGSPYQYDAAGNITADGTNSYTFNADNQVTTVAGVTYNYDGAGNRVKKSTGKLYWNGDGGEALDETDASGNLTDEYIFFGGTRIARRDASNNVVYYFSDHLGTAHVVANSSGTILDDSDFYPFGGERVVASSSGNAYKFTGKERDAESGLDNFGARYYASTTGRFLSPDDTKYASLADPQTWNLYSYVSNHPLTMTDPTGHSADPWAGRLGTAEYNSFTQEMQGGGAQAGGDASGGGAGAGGSTNDGEGSDPTYVVQTIENGVIQPVQYVQAPNAEVAMSTALSNSDAEEAQQQSTAPSNSRTDLVLYPSGSGQAYHSTAWFWEKDWKLGTCGQGCSEDPQKDTHTVSLSEQINGKGDWKSGGKDQGGFHDLISPESRTITQRFSVDGKRVQVVLGADKNGNLIKTWDVRVVVHGPFDDRPPTYSPIP